jgi:hypothetical protein
MRAKKISHSLRERRNPRRRGNRRGARTARAATPTPRASDLAVKRVREAGGPVDQASYNCECGYLFTAPVSTSVRCPHCHTGQAW